MPLQAINHEGDKTTVFIVNRDDKIEDRPITLGIQTATDAEVVSGLNEGEQVIVSDRSGLKSGQTVHAQVVQIMQYQESEVRVEPSASQKVSTNVRFFDP